MKEQKRTHTKQTRRGGFGITGLVLAVLTLMIWSPLSTVHRVSAGVLPLPPRPVVETPVPGVPTGPTRPAGGWIQLRARGVTDVSQWSDVQWQDGLGVWHTVESWYGQFDQAANGVGTKTWWVDQYTFGPTPFRWQVYDTANTTMLATSDPFNLPTQNRQTVAVTISLPLK